MPTSHLSIFASPPTQAQWSLTSRRPPEDAENKKARELARTPREGCENKTGVAPFDIFVEKNTELAGETVAGTHRMSRHTDVNKVENGNSEEEEIGREAERVGQGGDYGGEGGK